MEAPDLPDFLGRDRGLVYWGRGWSTAIRRSCWRKPARRNPETRAATRRRGGPRRKVELLLKEFENHESRLPKEERFDVSLLRRELGLDASSG
jgi:hypothetical protein